MARTAGVDRFCTQPDIPGIGLITCAWLCAVVVALPVETTTHCVDSNGQIGKEVSLLYLPQLGRPPFAHALDDWLVGMRVAAFVSGGLIPEKLRGTSNNMRFHIVDWCVPVASHRFPSPSSSLAPLSCFAILHHAVVNIPLQVSDVLSFGWHRCCR